MDWTEWSVGSVDGQRVLSIHHVTSHAGTQSVVADGALPTTRYRPNRPMSAKRYVPADGHFDSIRLTKHTALDTGREAYRPLLRAHERCAPAAPANNQSCCQAACLARLGWQLPITSQWQYGTTAATARPSIKTQHTDL